MIEELRQKESGSSADVIELHIRQHEKDMVSVSELAKITALSLEEVEEDIKELREEGRISVFPMKKETYVWHISSQ